MMQSMQPHLDNDNLSRQLIHEGANEKFRKILINEIRAETDAVSSKEVSDAHKTLSLFWKLNPVRGKDLSTRLLIQVVHLLNSIETEQKTIVPNVVTKIPANGLHGSISNAAPETVSNTLSSTVCGKEGKHGGDDAKNKRAADVLQDPAVIEHKVETKPSKRKKKDANDK